MAATSPGAASGTGNPAAPAHDGSSRLTFTHLSWAEEISREWAAAVWRLPDSWSLAVDAGLLRSPPLASYDEDGRETGTFQPFEWTAGAAVRIPLAGGVGAGVGVRTFRLEDDISPLTGFGCSFGLHWQGPERRLGVAVTDLGPDTSGGDAPGSLPTRWRAGFEHDFESGRWTAAVLAEDGPGRSPRIMTGLVIRPVAGLELLGGLARGTGGEPDPLGHWSAGGRLRHGLLELAYAFLPGGNLEPTHHLGITLILGGAATRLEHEPPPGQDPHSRR